MCISECYTLVSWSYLSFFHAERGRLGRGAGTCCRSVASGRCACGEISEITSYITERTHIVIHTQSIKHNDRWLRRRDTLPVPEEKHSHFVFRNVIFCVSPVRIPAVLSGRNRSYRAAVKGDDKNSKSSVCMICFIEPQLIGATEKPHTHTHTHTHTHDHIVHLKTSPFHQRGLFPWWHLKFVIMTLHQQVSELLSPLFYPSPSHTHSCTAFWCFQLLCEWLFELKKPHRYSRCWI